MDVTELHDEENLLVQMQDRWENYDSLDGIADTHDPFELAGAPRFELSEKINDLLNHALTEQESEQIRLRGQIVAIDSMIIRQDRRTIFLFDEGFCLDIAEQLVPIPRIIFFQEPDVVEETGRKAGQYRLGR